MLVQEPVQKIKVIEDNFSPVEAKQVMHSLIDQYINYYNLLYLRNWEADHHFNSADIDRKIKLLKSMKRNVEDTVRKAEREGCLLNLEELLQLNLIK